MRVVITGGTGFLGRALSSSLSADGHDVVVLTRAGAHTGQESGRSARDRVRTASWTPNGEAGPWMCELDGADAIVNLAGESIAGKRWTASQKERILRSRVDATRSIVSAIREVASRPSVLVNGSAVGYYGPHADDVVTEDTRAGDDFLARVCAQWEAEAERASSTRTRVVFVRTGLVLEKNGGALPQMLLPFKLGAGGPVGSGKQYWPWIHLRDWVGLVRWALQNAHAAGPVNATAPNPVTNAEFAKALGQAMHRPSFMPAPAFALRLALGELADGLLLSGQRAVPERASRQGFTFAHPHVGGALQAIFNS